MLRNSAKEHSNQQRIYPNIKFDCNGRIKTIRFAALEVESSDSTDQHPELQLWRENELSHYNKVTSVSLEKATRTDNLNTFNLALKEQVSFNVGDVLGLYVPRSGRVIQFLTSTSEAEDVVYGYGSSQYEASNDDFDLTESHVTLDNDIPMILLVSGKLQLWYLLLDTACNS